MKRYGYFWLGIMLEVISITDGTALAEPPPDVTTTPSETGGLQEIVVTAQKRSQNLQDVPIAIDAVSAAQLQAYGVSDINNITAAVPGVAVDSIAGSYFLPRIRGVGTSADGPGVENPVALYIDGVYYASQITAPHDLFDVDQMSVLKGPQGTLFGRNATGGVIQLATRDPHQEFQGILQTSYDNYRTSKSDVYVSGGISSDLAANLWLHYTTQSDGWGNNQFNGDQIDRIKRDLATRSKWNWTPRDGTTVKLNLDFANSADSLGGNYRPFPGTALILPGFRPSSNLWDSDSFLTPTNTERNGGGSITVDQDFGFAHLVDISAYRNWTGYFNFSPTASPTPGQDLFVRQRGDQASEELQLVSSSGSIITWATGFYYFYFDEGTGPSPAFQILLDGPLSPTPTSLHEIDVHTDTVTNSVAGFGQLTADVGANTNLTAGFRYTSERRDFIGYEIGFLRNGVSIGNLPLPPVAPELTFSKPTWRLAVDHKFGADVLAYVSYNRGFKSGGYNGLDPTNPPYQPETLDAYEGGLKTEFFDRRIRLNAAAYHYKYTNVQVSRYTDTAVIYNGAGATVNGLELDAEARITSQFDLSAGAAFMHSEFTRFPNAQFSTPLPDGGAALYSADAAGNRLPFSPDFTIDLAANYHLASPIGRIDLMVSDYYSAAYFTEADNFIRQSAYDYLNTSVTWNSKDERYSIKLWANNLTDKVVLTQGATLATGYIVSNSNPPRTFGITARYSF
jgi:iron complex outermembrane recepter protein